MALDEVTESEWGRGFRQGIEQERRRIAEVLRRDAEFIESLAAPGKAVFLAALLVASTSPDSERSTE